MHLSCPRRLMHGYVSAYQCVVYGPPCTLYDGIPFPACMRADPICTYACMRVDFEVEFLPPAPPLQRRSMFCRIWRLVIWRSGINKVTLRRARLVLGWVTGPGFNSRCRKPINSRLHQAKLSHNAGKA